MNKIFISYFSKLLIIVYLSLFSACNNKTTIANNKYYYNWNHQQQLLLNIKHYKLSGVITYISNEYNISANFYWQQTNKNNYKFILTNQSNTIKLCLDVINNTTNLVINNNILCYQQPPGIVIKQLFNIDVPFKYLNEIILGIIKGNQYFTLNKYGYLNKTILHDNNNVWNIIYSKHHYYHNNVIVLSKYVELYCKNTNIKIKIHDWII
ncbi:MAG: lipoprotein insertase outer membrane protein LolB [Candidatus Lightella neohaematopini]|nr:lipoprotein insertase outer membrane protein LolB [Candidatus Lightella neohaematopini]